jgi:hypothetical protein
LLHLGRAQCPGAHPALCQQAQGHTGPSPHSHTTARSAGHRHRPNFFTLAPAESSSGLNIQPVTLYVHSDTVDWPQVPSPPHRLTKPLPMMRQRPLSESQSLLVKWNCASWELRNRGPSVVWG